MDAIAPLRALPALDATAYADVRRRAIFELGKWDVQVQDTEVIAPFALALDRPVWIELARDAEALARETLAAEREILGRPRLMRALGLPRDLVRSLCSRDNDDVRVMRFDFHLTDDGWRISENNCDVPGGFIEAHDLARMFADSAHVTCGDPAAVLAHALRTRTREGARVALVHATAHSEDRQVMNYLARALDREQLMPVLASPEHPFSADAIVRFFPADWLPRTRGNWARFANARVPMANPACAVVAQTKRFPLAWDSLATPLPTWRRLLPETRDVRDVPFSDLDSWVLKPALGRVGENVLVPGIATRDRRAVAYLHARVSPHAFIAQRKFDAVPIETPDGPRFPSLGVFVIDGHACGVYARIARVAKVDGYAQDVAVLT